MALINKLNDFPLQTRALKSGVQAWREAGEGDPLAGVGSPNQQLESRRISGVLVDEIARSFVGGSTR